MSCTHPAGIRGDGVYEVENGIPFAAAMFLQSISTLWTKLHFPYVNGALSSIETVGAVVGAVGLIVGLVVGLFVGLVVGLFVGFFVGEVVGFAVVGLVVGLNV